MRNQVHINPTPIRRRLAVVGLIAAATVAVIPAAQANAASTWFGSKVNKTVQPSNSLPAHDCFLNTPGACTRVMVNAYQNPGGAKAPKTGKIKRIKLIAGGKGSFRLFVAKARPNQEKAKLVRKGPRLKYQGQDPNWDDPYEIDKFKVNLPIKKGQYLAVRSRKTSMIRCSSGGDEQLLFQPALPLGGPFQAADGTDGCFLLLKAKVSY